MTTGIVPRLLASVALIFCPAIDAMAAPRNIDLVILLDVSTRMADSARVITSGARIAAHELASGDRVGVMTYSGAVKTILPLTGDTANFESAVRKAGNWMVERGEQHLFDALLAALQNFPAQPVADRVRTVIVFTDSSDIGSRHGADEVVARAKSKGVSISVVLLSPEPVPLPRGVMKNVPNMREETLRLEPLVLPTGGVVRVYPVTTYVLDKAIAELRPQ